MSDEHPPPPSIDDCLRASNAWVDRAALRYNEAQTVDDVIASRAAASISQAYAVLALAQRGRTVTIEPIGLDVTVTAHVP